MGQLHPGNRHALVGLGMGSEGDPAAIHVILQSIDVRRDAGEVHDDPRRVESARQGGKREGRGGPIDGHSRISGSLVRCIGSVQPWLVIAYRAAIAA